MRRLLILAVLFSFGCDSDSPPQTQADLDTVDIDAEPELDLADDLGVDTGVDTDAADDLLDVTRDPDADAVVDLCVSDVGELPEGLVELGWDDGEPVSHVGQQAWTITVGGETYALAEEVSWEAVRFEIDHPARIHGFSIQWGGLPSDDDPTVELRAGLYPDFGHNGMDFWRWDPLFVGTRCMGDISEQGWTTYVLDEPVEMAQPGLVYVAHHRAGPSAPAFLFDGTYAGEGECSEWDDCHSAMNLPEAQAALYYNGITFPMATDYVVRLWVEHTEQLPTESRIFQPVDGPVVSSRVSWGDYDNDGWDDYLTNGPALWRNNGDGTFVETTTSSGIRDLGVSGSGGVWGDYDNDGCLDAFIFSESHTVADTLLHSLCDGTFEDATDSAGIVDEQDYNDCDSAANIRSPSPAAAWVDIDSDGLLDIYVANMMCWSDYTYYADTVWHNEGDGTFADWSGTHGFSSIRTASRGVSPIDVDGDRDMDLLVNNYVLQANLFYENAGNGTVRESAQELGLAGIRNVADLPRYGHTIGTAWGDIDNDGDFDVIVANLAHPRFYHFSDKTQVLVNDGGNFVDNAGDWALPRGASGLRYQETHSVPVLADFDADGNLDLVITAVYSGRPTDFYWGRGDGTFELDVYRAGITTENGWGAAAADYDHDGDMDLAAHRLFENTLSDGGHWLQVRPIGNLTSNRAAIGATVRVFAGDQVRVRHVQGGSGQGCQDSQTLHFGLGDIESVDSIRVEFPGGRRANYSGPFAVDQRLWLFENGTAHAGWSPP